MVSGVLFEQLESDSRNYIDLVDKLNAHGLNNQIPTPKIVVIGDQSSGKSSILENLAGIELPKGVGTVTKCALEIQMRAPQNGEEGCKMWIDLSAAGFGFTDPKTAPFSFENTEGGCKISENEIADTIRKQTKWCLDESEKQFAKTTEKSCGFTKARLVLRIVKAGLQNLTLIDLPGIIRVGDETAKKLIDDLILNYIQQHDVIMLAVVPCNQDIDTSACLALATKHDPDGNRTFVALTKPDLIDKGAEAPWIKVIQDGYAKCPNIVGYSLVKNRSQLEVQENKNLAEAQKDEVKYFNETEPWKSVPKKESFGIKSMAKRLSDLQVETITKFLPTIKQKLSEKTAELETQLSKLGETLPESDSAKLQIALGLVKNLIFEINSAFEPNGEQNLGTDFGDIFEKFTEKISATKANLDQANTIERLEKEVNSCRGLKLPFFPSYDLAKREIRNILKEWKLPSIDAIEEAHEILEDFFLKISKEISAHGQYPTFANKANAEMCKVLHERQKILKTKVDEKLKIMTQIPHTQNDYYGSNVQKMMFEDLGIPDPTTFQIQVQNHGGVTSYLNEYTKVFGKVEKLFKSKKFEAIQLLAMIKSYWSVCFKSYCDHLTSEILNDFVHHLQQDVAKALEALVGENMKNLDSLLKVDEAHEMKRNQCQTGLKTLKNCMEILEESMIY